MDWFKIICLITVTVYTVFIVCNIFILVFRKKENVDLENYNPSTQITIIIPARNEEQSILKCLESISLQKFPKDLLQVIVVDDQSTDKTFYVAETFLKDNFSNYQLLKLSSSSGKKQAILKAIEQASGKIII